MASVKGPKADVTLSDVPETISTYPLGDVRNDPIGPLKNLINWVLMGEKPRLLRWVVGIFFHIELPSLVYPLRMAHPFGIVINGGAKLGRNLTIFQHGTIGSKSSGRNTGVSSIADNERAREIMRLGIQ